MEFTQSIWLGGASIVQFSSWEIKKSRNDFEAVATLLLLGGRATGPLQIVLKGVLTVARPPYRTVYLRSKAIPVF